MKVLYIAGPYGDSGGYLAIEDNITVARKAAAFLARNGIGFCSPHLNFAHFEVVTPDVPVSFWRELDIRLLKGCDGIYMLRGWQASEGAREERDAAREMGLPLFYDSGYESDRLALLAWAGR